MSTNRHRRCRAVRGLIASAIGLVALQTPAQVQVYQLGGTGANGWQSALSFAPGEVVARDLGGSRTVTGQVRTPLTHPSWAETLTVVVDSTGGQWLRPLHIPDTLNLARDGVRARVPAGPLGNLATSDDRCGNNRNAVERIRPSFDGDPTTAAFFQATASEDPNDRLLLFVQSMIVDLGADYPVNRIRFYPRLGRSNPGLEGILRGMGAPRLAAEALPEEDFSENLLRWYEVAAAGAGAGFPDECVGAGADGRDPEWFLSISGNQRRTANDSRFDIVARSVENQDVVVEIGFPARPLRWVALRPLYPTKNWEVAELEVYGEGHVPRAVYRTAVLDFGRAVVFGSVRWSGQQADSARVEVRSRTGRDPEPNVYWRLNPRGQGLEEVDREEFGRAPVRQRAVSDDRAGWSAWTPPYRWDEATSQDGATLISPSPARYLQLQLVFFSRGADAARLRQLEILLSDPAAQRVVAEIWPARVPRGEVTPFTYVLRPTLVDGDPGFDRLEIFTLTRAASVPSVRVDGEEVSGRFPPDVRDDRIVVGFPRLRGGRDTDKLVEVVFAVPVVLFGTEFRGWVYQAGQTGARQLVVAGDALLDYPGNSLRVETQPLARGHLGAVTVAPRVVTPNADGIGEEATFRFKVFDVTAPTALSVVVHGLSGARVRQVWSGDVVHGVYGEGPAALAWDGRDDAGRAVAPGVYLYRVTLESDDGHEERTGTLAVAY